MASITAWAKKVWKDRKTEYPTRRTLTKTDGSQEIVTVARNEGNVSQEGDAFSAVNMNDLEERIDAGFAEVTSKLEWKRLGTKVGTDGLDIPKNANEICINVYLADSEYPQYYKTIPIDLLGDTASNVLIDSTYYSPEDYVYITARISKTFVNLRLVWVNGKNVTSTTNMVVSYR